MQLYIIRHGETEYNRRGIIQGHTEVPLNDTGIDQASRLGAKLKSARLDRVYSSDLRRAAMTAGILCSHIGAPLIFDEGFRERNPGDLAHRTHEEGAAFFHDLSYLPPNGEGVEEFDARIRGAFERLIELEGDARGRLGVVTHGMVCGSFLRTFLGYTREKLASVGWRNTSLTVAEYNGAWKLITLSDASHLDEGENAAASGTGA